MQHDLCKILLVGTLSEKGNEMIPLLKSHNYNIDYAERYEDALQKIVNEETSLVISGQKINGYHGFEVYNKLRNSLKSAGVSHFMVLDKFEKEEILIGLASFLLPVFLKS